jgi:hypothetical protein
MPPLSTHFRLATLVTSSLGIVPHTGYFILGTTAPDAFEPDSEISFSRHHFRAVDGKISLPDFLKATGFLSHSSDDAAWSFTCGYYCHLWLDVYFRDSADRIPFRRPAGVQDSDLRSLVRKQTEILNAPFVLSLSHLPVSGLKALNLPPGLEFIDLERCTHLFHEVVKQSQAWSDPDPKFESMDPDEFAAFLADASMLFLLEIQTIA